MKKVFRMANAELNKIFLRPSMFVLSTILVLALVLSFFLFKPQTTTQKYTYDGINTAQIYLEQFEKDHEKIKNELVNAKKEIVAFISAENDTLANIQKLFNEAFESENQTGQFFVLYDEIINMDKTQFKPNAQNIKKISTELSYFSELLNNLRVELSTKVKNKSVNFFITTEDYENIYKTLKSINDNLPTTTEIKDFTTDEIINRFNLLIESYNIKNINKTIHALEKIKIDSSELSSLLNKYYFNNIEEVVVLGQTEYKEVGKLNELYTDIKTYYHENLTSTNKDVLNSLNEKIAKYYDYVQINKAMLSNNFELLRIGNKTDDEIVKYNGFSGTSVYNLKQEITIGDYFLKNNTFGYEYLSAFNFNTNSGTETNAFDFAFFAMQILSALIILFIIYFACGIISGEQNTGTLKMTAIRPYSRNKLYSGKLLACFNVALILMTISLVASFAVGIACFGFTTQKVLLVVNASKVLVVSPIWVMLIHFISLLIDILFYLLLAVLISMIIKPTTISTAITSSIFIISTIISGLVTSSWIRFIPSLNVGLYKFFTVSKVGMFSYSIGPSLNMIQSLIIIFASIIIFDMISRIIFKNKSLDK